MCILPIRVPAIPGYDFQVVPPASTLPLDKSVKSASNCGLDCLKYTHGFDHGELRRERKYLDSQDILEE
ncbi:hypothetical protein N7539_007806 [Penicillium diatomitis]|uniref:Uncharacterized protein n=1 Tax=Penicillium diatomitis TaxID=2819901 RepID=A0A9W9WU48_9EURO|nr:uncharacterized protein N7539_007806 [Penicillium diatomitis]KAJ5475519.1 hypothetical protein N7539_007806 [Penicillium diatomitis]